MEYLPRTVLCAAAIVAALLSNDGHTDETPDRVERAAKKAARHVDKAAHRAKKGSERTVDRAGKWADRTGKRAADKTERWIKEKTE